MEIGRLFSADAWKKFGLSIKNAVFNGDVLNKVITVIIILILALIVYKIAVKVIRKSFEKSIDRKEDFGEQKRMTTIQSLSIRFAKTVIIIAAVLLVLGQFVNISALIAVAGVGTIAIGLGAQHLVEDLLAGFMILSEHQFHVGDYVELEDGKFGEVEEISLRTTRVRLLNNSLYIIQNGQIGRIINYSKGAMNVKVFVSVAYESDLDKVIEAMKAAGKKAFEQENSYFVKMPVVYGASEFGDSGITMLMTGAIWAENKTRAEGELRKVVKETFDEYGIEIPYNKVVLMTAEDAPKEDKAHGAE